MSFSFKPIISPRLTPVDKENRAMYLILEFSALTIFDRSSLLNTGICLSDTLSEFSFGIVTFLPLHGFLRIYPQSTA